MEDGLRAWGPEAGKLIGLIVLILVLMEDGLRVVGAIFGAYIILNVLILVLMEDGLRATISIVPALLLCLNPCFNGRWSARRCLTQQRQTEVSS